MTALTHHPRRALALGVAIAIALLALLPGTWSGALAQTAGTPPAFTCSAGFTLSGDSCVRTVTNDLVTVTGVSDGTGEVVIGDSDDPISVTIPAGYPAGATFAAVTETTTTIASDGTTSTISKVVSLTCTGNCTEQPVTMRISLNFVSTQSLSGLTVSQLRDDVCESFGLTGDCLINFIRSVTSTTMRLDPGVGQQLISFGVSDSSETGAAPQQTGPDTIEATLLPGGFLEADLPPGDWGLQAVAIEGATPTGGGPAAPSPANTGMGGEDSGATNPLAIALGAAALAGAVGLGGCYVARRRSA